MTIDIKNGKEAETNFSVIKRLKIVPLIVHFEYINHPVVGDFLYGSNNKKINDGQILHAYKISFFHPRNNKKMVFTTSLPSIF